MPIAHAEGCFIDSSDALDELEQSSRVVFRYTGPDGETDDEESNVNGSARAIAGVCNAEGNVLGMMPHPERCAEQVFANQDGLTLFAAAVGAGAESGVGAVS